jgi:hypothetical protein
MSTKEIDDTDVTPPEELGSDVTPPEEVETPVIGDDEMKQRQQEPTFFSDERGNLKAVNLVVRHPCKIFWLIMVSCILMTFLLQVLVFATAEDGIPITSPDNEFDIDDLRSIQYDSLRLAKDEVQKDRDAENQASQATPKQSEVNDLAYWVYESETAEGLFGTAESIETMKNAFDIFTEDERFIDWCLLDYRTPLAENATRECDIPLTPLRMYFASKWDSEKVAAIVEQLKDPEKVATFNTLALCYITGLYCDLVPNSTSTEDITWAIALGTNITGVTDSWDMKGDLVENITQATEFAAYLIQVDVFKGIVDFGYDKGFSVENPVSQYSRGIIFWGGPLENQNTELTADEKEAQEENENDIRKE